ncbi:MAG: Transcriptional regulator [Candidatus Roizmanbacteria bacterium GW2011_GWA2_37_7]|uniref:Transcriptional regulator n=1 Tax=Candidatus Roizmanbacteria bacterium GW2011_GWA2_37_7 TaxID=1618481 RepID=A0A0G0H0Z8_9BACT|nr:MAG: Transcriptional regulator [Candidatus Roizmanbacteria bacterium GW2011_GWA2_37_7]
MLENIIPSKVRRKILELYFHHIDDSYYLREIVRMIEEEVNAVKRELDILHDAKVLLRERRTNKVFFTLNKNYILYDEFLRIFTKTTSLADLLFTNQSRLGKVKYIAISIKYVKRAPIKEGEIYALFVGVVVVPEVESIMNTAKKDFGWEINYTVMTEDELQFRKKNNDPFIWKFLKQPKVMLVGQEEDLIK